MRRIRSSYRKKAQAQLDASQKYKDCLRKEGIPLRDDLARALFSAIIEELAEMRQKAQGERYQRWLDRIVGALPEHFDRDKSEDVLRAIVSRYINEHGTPPVISD
jgi:hypothetical protein